MVRPLEAKHALRALDLSRSALASVSARSLNAILERAPLL
jgi:hypothetical protein